MSGCDSTATDTASGLSSYHTEKPYRSLLLSTMFRSIFVALLLAAVGQAQQFNATASTCGETPFVLFWTKNTETDFRNKS
jgi:hypothetical protein